MTPTSQHTPVLTNLTHISARLRARLSRAKHRRAAARADAERLWALLSEHRAAALRAADRAAEFGRLELAADARRHEFSRARAAALDDFREAQERVASAWEKLGGLDPLRDV